MDGCSWEAPCDANTRIREPSTTRSIRLSVCLSACLPVRPSVGPSNPSNPSKIHQIPSFKEGRLRSSPSIPNLRMSPMPCLFVEMRPSRRRIVSEPRGHCVEQTMVREVWGLCSQPTAVSNPIQSTSFTHLCTG